MENRFVRAYIHNEQLHIIYDVEISAQNNLHVSDNIGKGLLDFISLDRKKIDKVFDTLAKRYKLCLITKGNETFESIKRSLVHASNENIKINTYLAQYIANAIVFLTEDGISQAVLEVLSSVSGLSSEKLIKKYSIYTLKRMYIYNFPFVIAEQQKRLESEIDLVLGEDSLLKDFTPEQRLYILSRSSKYDVFYLKKQSEFKSSLNTFHNYSKLNDEELCLSIKSDNAEFFEMYDFANLDELMGFEIIQMVLRSCNVKRCSNCRRFFIPSGRTDSKYCDRIMPGENKPCNEIGAFRKRAELVKTNPVYISYIAAVKRMSKRKRSGLSEKRYREWSWQATDMRDKCLNDEISLQEFNAWLDKTSRLNKKNKTC